MPVSARSYRVPRDRQGYQFSAEAIPAIRVPSGSTITFETLDCFGNRLTVADQRYHREEELLAVIGAYNPVAGPVYVAGALPGDVLAVTIEEIRLGTAAPFAVTMIFGNGSKYVSAPCPGIPPEGDTKICPIEDGRQVRFPTAAGELRLPCRPMVGTIGTAPASGSVPSLFYDRQHGGNMDCPQVTSGSVVYLPVNVPGALLSLGDVHALMGDAEITGTALETSGDVTVRVAVLPGAAHPMRLPHVDSDQTIGAIGCIAGARLEANLEAAMLEIHHRLAGEYGLIPADAYQLSGATARVVVGQCVAPPRWTAVYVGVPRPALPQPALPQPALPQPALPQPALPPAGAVTGAAARRSGRTPPP
jgi:amidase